MCSANLIRSKGNNLENEVMLLGVASGRCGQQGEAAAAVGRGMLVARLRCGGNQLPHIAPYNSVYTPQLLHISLHHTRDKTTQVRTSGGLPSTIASLLSNQPAPSLSDIIDPRLRDRMRHVPHHPAN